MPPQPPIVPPVAVALVRGEEFEPIALRAVAIADASEDFDPRVELKRRFLARLEDHRARDSRIHHVGEHHDPILARLDSRLGEHWRVGIDPPAFQQHRAEVLAQRWMNGVTSLSGRAAVRRWAISVTHEMHVRR